MSDFAGQVGQTRQDQSVASFRPFFLHETFPPANEHVSLMAVAATDTPSRPPVSHQYDPLQRKSYDWFVKAKDRVLDDRCGICLSNFEGIQAIACLPCLHFFHEGCVLKSIDVCDERCPTCRVRLSDEFLRAARTDRTQRL